MALPIYASNLKLNAALWANGVTLEMLVFFNPTLFREYLI
jgi:hypothetical protein